MPQYFMDGIVHLVCTGFMVVGIVMLLNARKQNVKDNKK